MSKFLTSRLERLNPYKPGEQIRGKKTIKLNTNESPYPPSPMVLDAVNGELGSLNLYPDITGGSLLQELAAWFGVERENVFAGNGSDEILAFLFQGFCQNGAAFADLSYGFYPVYADLYNISAKVIPVKDDLSIDITDYFGLKETVLIANPNAPTGIALPASEVERLLKANRETLVVVDEAYVDFGAESCVPLLESYDNLLVVGTFSKSRSLAGARLGYAVSSKELITDLEMIKYSFNPYNINQMTMAAGTAALQDKSYFSTCCDKIINTRARCANRLSELGFTCTNSSANFIFARHSNRKAQDIYVALKERDILVRWFDKPRIDGYLRISVGSDTDMDTLVDALRDILNKLNK